jgi:hypothetical protein
MMLVNRLAMARWSMLFILFLVCIHDAPAADRISEEDAVSRLQKTTASLIDPALPRRSFAGWLNEKFRNWDIQWKLSDCLGSESANAQKDEALHEIPVCVQVNIMQPGQEVHGDTSDGFHMLFLIGSQKKGFITTPRLRAATRQDGEEVVPLTSLRDVEP